MWTEGVAELTRLLRVQGCRSLTWSSRPSGISINIYRCNTYIIYIYMYIHIIIYAVCRATPPKKNSSTIVINQLPFFLGTTHRIMWYLNCPLSFQRPIEDTIASACRMAPNGHLGESFMIAKPTSCPLGDCFAGCLFHHDAWSKWFLPKKTIKKIGFHG